LHSRRRRSGGGEWFTHYSLSGGFCAAMSAAG
jgi:hypothetical protein